MIKKYNNEYVDKCLIGRNIQRLNDCTGALQKCQWKCLVEGCNHIWQNSPVKICLILQGCAKCKGSLLLTNEEIDKKLIGRNIQRIGDYINALSKIKFKCLVNNCNYIWLSNTNNIISNNRGCPKCSGHLKLSNEIIDSRLSNNFRTIKRVGDYKNISSKIEWQCNVCNYIWLASPNEVVNIFHGCPKCGGSLKSTNEIVDKKLSDACRPITRIGDYKDSHTKIEWQCNDCDYIWSTSPDKIINSFTGCPVCPYKNQKIVYSTLRSLKIDFEFQKDIRTLNDKENRKCLLDFYIPNLFIAIEYDGAQHYYPVIFGYVDIKKADPEDVKRSKENFIKQQERDKYIDQFCIDNNINLIRINGTVYKNKKLANYVREVIKSQIDKNSIDASYSNEA